MRETTLTAYKLAESSGLLSARRLQVLRDICEHGPCTQLETWRRVSPQSNSGAITTRFSELERMDVIKVVGEKRDALTGAVNSMWDVTGNPPKPLHRVSAKDQAYNAALEDYLKEVDRCLGLSNSHQESLGYRDRAIAQRIAAKLRRACVTIAVAAIALSCGSQEEFVPLLSEDQFKAAAEPDEARFIEWQKCWGLSFKIARDFRGRRICVERQHRRPHEFQPWQQPIDIAAHTD